MNKWEALIILGVFLLISVINNSSASSPVEIPFQASGFRDGAGTLIANANVSMFIFNASSGGLPIYNETFLNGMTNGYVSVTMGENLSRTLNLTWGNNYWLALNVSGVGVQMINGSNDLTWRKHFIATQGRIEGLDTLNATIQNLLTSNTSIYNSLGQASQNFTSLGTSNSSIWTAFGLVSINFTAFTTSNSSIWTQLGLISTNFTSLGTSNTSLWTAIGATGKNATYVNTTINSLINRSTCASGFVLANVSWNATGIYGNCTADATTTTGGMTAMDLMDTEFYFQMAGFECAPFYCTAPWNSTSIATGTNRTGVGTIEHPGIVNASSSATALSGFAHVIHNADIFSLDLNYTTQASFRPNAAKVYWNSSGATLPVGNNGTKIRFGFLDVWTTAEPVDGVYFNITQLNDTMFDVRGIARANSVQTNTAGNYTFQNSSWLTFTVYLNATNLATFIVSNGTGILWNDTVATNIPVGVGRETSDGIVAYQNGSTFGGAQTLYSIDRISVGVNRKLIR